MQNERSFVPDNQSLDVTASASSHETFSSKKALIWSVSQTLKILDFNTFILMKNFNSKAVSLNSLRGHLTQKLFKRDRKFDSKVVDYFFISLNWKWQNMLH